MTEPTNLQHIRTIGTDLTRGITICVGTTYIGICNDDNDSKSVGAWNAWVLSMIISLSPGIVLQAYWQLVRKRYS